MANVLLTKTYKARKAGGIHTFPQAEAEAIERLGLGEILKEPKPEPVRKADKTEKAEKGEASK